MKTSIFVIIIVLTIFGTSQGLLLIVDQKMARMMEFNSQTPYCHLSTDRDYIQDTILNTEQKRIKVLSDEEINKIEIICKKRQLKTSYQGGFIYPGTKWCGPGTVAENYTDLGNHKREDICCREHDHCPNFIPRGECKQGICNKSLYTRSHCDCDAEFRRCLQNVNSETANTIGAIFFNIVQVICFKQRSPCTQFQSIPLELDNALGGDDPNCTIEFFIGERYVPSDLVYHYSTKGEVVESYFNRLLKKLNFL